MAGEMPGETIEPRQVMVAHQAVWRALTSLADMNDMVLERLPDGVGDDGTPFFREDRPETECPQCGHTPTYAFMPKPPSPAQGVSERIRSQGMCGRLVDGGKRVCILAPGHDLGMHEEAGHAG